MATPARHFCRSLFQVTRRLPAKRKGNTVCLYQSTWPSSSPFRQLSSTTIRRADNSIDERSANTQDVSDAGKKETGIQSRRQHQSDAEQGGQGDNSMVDELEEVLYNTHPPDPSLYQIPTVAASAEDLTQDEIDLMKELLGNSKGDPVGLYNHLLAQAEALEKEDEMDKSILDRMERDIEDEDDIDFPEDFLSRRDQGWHAMGEEDDEFAMVEDGDEEHDDSDITSVAHSELDVHREIREYTRVVAWDMPLLQNFVKPFQVPTEAQPLRFRYTTYLGESHPAARKVVLQFCPKDLPGLTEAQRTKLLKLLGPRYNPETDIVKMSSEKFEAPAQNKRHLGDLINKLIDEAKNGKDSFEDVPLDLRHHKATKKARFPEQWKLTPERVQYLLNERREQKLLEASTPPKALDGKEFVHSYVQSLRIRAQNPQRTL